MIFKSIEILNTVDTKLNVGSYNYIEKLNNNTICVTADSNQIQFYTRNLNQKNKLNYKWISSINRA